MHHGRVALCPQSTVGQARMKGFNRGRWIRIGRPEVFFSVQLPERKREESESAAAAELCRRARAELALETKAGFGSEHGK